MRSPLSVDYLTHILEDSRLRTLELVNDLDDEQLMGPRLEVVNPLLWEIGHLAWFHEIFILRWLDGHRDDAGYVLTWKDPRTEKEGQIRLAAVGNTLSGTWTQADDQDLEVPIVFRRVKP